MLWRHPPRVTTSIRGGEHLPSLASLFSADRALITIGGVSLGGLGKTELALWLVNTWAQRFKAQDASLLCHGYLGQASQPELVLLKPRLQLLESERIEALRRWGDEAMMLRWRLPAETKIWVGGTWQERVEKSHDSGAIFQVCDGGLYRAELKPTTQLCLIDPQLKPRMIPWGDLSRPISCFPQNVSWWSHALSLDTCLPSYFEQSCAPLIARSAYRHLSLITPDGQRISSAFLRGKRVQPWVGIARPQRFLNTLKDLQAHLADPILSLNHRSFSKKSLKTSQKNPSYIRVCTYKDLPKIPIDLEMYVLEPTFYVEPTFL